MTHLPQPDRKQREPRRGPQGQPRHHLCRQRLETERRKATGDEVEGCRQDEQHQTRAEPPARKAEGAAKRQSQCDPQQPERAHRRFHQPLGSKILQPGEEKAASPIDAATARAADQRALKNRQLIDVLDQQRLAANVRCG